MAQAHGRPPVCGRDARSRMMRLRLTAREAHLIGCAIPDGMLSVDTETWG